MAKYSGSGWHNQSIRHSNARKYGRAGGKYSSLVSASMKGKSYKNLSPADTRYLAGIKAGYTHKEMMYQYPYGLSTKKHYGKTKPSAPLKKKSTELPIQFSINVPSTKNIDEPISTKEFQARIDETKNFLSKTFGGDTEIKGKGDYTKDGRLIQDDVSVIESSMKPEAYKENKKKLEEYITKKQKEWTQDTIGYSFEDAFYIYPKFD